MPLKIVRNDITLMNVDAIVNPTDNQLTGIFSTDGAIHKAAGDGLKEECKRIGFCDTGSAVITGGYNLPAKYVIHTVGPVWEGGSSNEKEILESCYRNCLELAKENGCTSIAFPVIASGTYGFPKDKAMLTANKVITEFLYDNDMDIYLIVYDHASAIIGEALFSRIEEYIDDNYVGKKEREFYEGALSHNIFSFSEDNISDDKDNLPAMSAEYHCENAAREKAVRPGIFHKKTPRNCLLDSDDNSSKILKHRLAKSKKLPDSFVVDESFFEMVSRYIDEYGWSDPYFYNKALLTKSVFSKMKKAGYKPAKKTAVACALRLELSSEKADELLAKAGFALSNAYLFDVIIKACIDNGMYDIIKVNSVLLEHDQELLGV